MEQSGARKIVVVGGGISGRYLAGRFGDAAPGVTVTLIARERAPAPQRKSVRESVETVNGRCTSLTETARGVAAGLENSRTCVGDIAVLATGCGSFGGPGDELFASPHHLPRRRDASVLVLGTGLPAIDYVLRLIDSGHQGPVSLLSRSGLLPRAGQVEAPYEIELADIPLGTGLCYLSRWIRATIRWCAAQGHEWRAVVDGLKPHAAAIWRHLGERDRRRYLAHIRSFWDACADRTTDAQAAKIAAWAGEGRLSILRGRHVAAKETEDGFEVELNLRGRARTGTLAAQFIVNCEDAPAGLSSFSRPIVAKLIRDGLARPDTLEFGLDVSTDCALIHADGRPSRRLFAIGAATRGHFYDALELPRIRKQSDRIVRHILRTTFSKAA